MLDDPSEEIAEPKVVAVAVEVAGEGVDLSPDERGSLRAGWVHWASGLGVLGVLGLGLGWVLPDESLGRAKLGVRGCVFASMLDDVDPAMCDVGGQWVGRLSPLTRSRALRIRAEAQYQVARHELFARVREAQGLAARELALAQLLEAAEELGEFGVYPDHDPGSQALAVEIDLLEDLLATGALGLAVEVGLERAELRLENPEAWPALDWGLRAAVIARGDFEQLKILARASDADVDSAQTRERGAWLCLLGDRDAGAERLHARATGIQYNVHTKVDSLAWLGWIACTDGEFIPAQTPLADPDSLAWLAARDVARHPDRFVWELDSLAQYQRRLPVLAQALAYRDPDADELLDWLGAGEGILPEWVRPSQRTRAMGQGKLFPPGHVFYGPDTMLEAGKKVAARVDEALAGGAFEATEGEAHQALVGLSTLAGLLALEAGVELTIRGQYERAHEALMLARGRLPRRNQWLTAWPLLSVGAVGDSLEWVQERRKELTPGQAMLSRSEREEWIDMGLLELELLARLRRFEQLGPILEELDAATSHEFERGWQRDVLGPWRGELSGTRTTAGLSQAPIYRFMSGALPRLDTRFDPHTPADAIEMALDVGFCEDLAVHGRASLWARAELAHERSDEDAQAHWRGRIAAIEALASDEDRAILLWATGL